MKYTLQSNTFFGCVWPSQKAFNLMFISVSMETYNNKCEWNTLKWSRNDTKRCESVYKDFSWHDSVWCVCVFFSFHFSCSFSEYFCFLFCCHWVLLYFNCWDSLLWNASLAKLTHTNNWETKMNCFLCACVYCIQIVRAKLMLFVFCVCRIFR